MAAIDGDRHLPEPPLRRTAAPLAKIPNGVDAPQNFAHAEAIGGRRIVEQGVHRRDVVGHQRPLIGVEGGSHFGQQGRVVDLGRRNHAGCACRQWRAISMRRATHASPLAMT